MTRNGTKIPGLLRAPVLNKEQSLVSNYDEESGSVGLELFTALGPVVGAGVNVFSSSRCEDETYFSFYFGGQGGLAVRFGSQDQYMVEAHAIMHTAPTLRCSNFGKGMTAAVYHERDFETVGGAVTLGSL